MLEYTTVVHVFQVNNVNDQIFAFMVAFNVMFGFAFLASSFVIFIVKERVSGKFCNF